jgi:WD40 repeat protein
MVSGSAETRIKVWNLRSVYSGELPRTLYAEDWVASVAISPDGQTLVSGSYDKTIKVWSKK